MLGQVFDILPTPSEGIAEALIMGGCTGTRCGGRTGGHQCSSDARQESLSLHAALQGPWGWCQPIGFMNAK